MEIGAFGVSRLGRDAIQASSFQAWISRGATMDAVPPGVARLRIVTRTGEAAYLALEATADEVAFLSPGSPVVTSDADGSGALVWVLDANLPCAAPLVGPAVPHPMLYFRKL